jgi:hypothetical protein
MRRKRRGCIGEEDEQDKDKDKDKRMSRMGTRMRE